METEYIYEGDLTNFSQGSAEGNAGTEVDSVTAAAVAGIADQGEIVTGIDSTMVTMEDVNGGDAVDMLSGGVVDGGLISSDHLPILGASSHITQPDAEISTEDQLKSVERLDRSSPDLWPQNLPTAAQHILAKNSLKSGEAEQPLGIWAQGLDPEDINLLHQFGSLTSSSLVEEVKKLQNIAYQLGLEEAKEMTRGKLLHVLDESDLNATDREQARYIQSMWK